MQRYLPQARADRIIVVSRLLLAVFSLVALHVDPDLIPVPLAPARAVLTTYTIYALLLLLFRVGFASGSQRIRVALLVIDFVVFTAVLALTRAAASPFFVFFVFSLLCATLRFRARGTIVAAVAAGVVYVILAALQRTLSSDPGVILLRLGYLAVIALFLTHLARYQQRTSEELASIAAWPREVPARLESVLAGNLRSAAALMHAPRAVAIVEESEEPWLTVADFRDGAIDVRRLPPGKLDETPGLSSPIGGDRLFGRIVFSGREWSSDDVALAKIASRLVSAQLEQFSVQEDLRRAAVGDERIRVARDLHDGLLQSLTGLALQIQTLIQSTEDDALRGRLSALQEIIAADQRELRSFVSQLRPDRATIVAPLSARLQSLAERIAEQWSIVVEVNVPPSPVLPSFIASEVYSLVAESLVNAAKHAHASHVRANVAVDGGEVRIHVEDDGAGFPFAGTYTLDRLDAEHRGPVTLKERIAALGGDLVLETSERGSRIEMRIAI